MLIGSKSVRTCLVTAFALAILCCSVSSLQAQPRLGVTVGDTTGSSGEHNSVVTVYLNNLDNIAAFTLRLRVTEPGIALFQAELDTIEVTTHWLCTEEEMGLCVDSEAVDFPELQPWTFFHIDTVEAYLGNFDLTGSLIENWEYVESRSTIVGGEGMDMKMTAIADRLSIGGTQPPLGPQGGGVLFRLLADLASIPPEQENRSVGIQVDVDWKPNFIFSTPEGDAIGWIFEYGLDTNYYECTDPVPPPGSGCYEWTKVYERDCVDGCDSVRIDVDSTAILDESAVIINDGSITIDIQAPWVCGDVNGDPEGMVSIGDVALLVDHLFITGSPIEPLERGNVNCSTEDPLDLSIGDVAALVDHLFITKAPLCCEY